ARVIILVVEYGISADCQSRPSTGRLTWILVRFKRLCHCSKRGSAFATSLVVVAAWVVDLVGKIANPPPRVSLRVRNTNGQRVASGLLGHALSFPTRPDVGITVASRGRASLACVLAVLRRRLAGLGRRQLDRRHSFLVD